MGNCFATICRRRNVRRHIVLILIGLDNAGKTKTVNNLVGDRDDKVLPTVGFKAVNLIHKDTPVTIYDLGGGPQFRQIWPQYYSEVHGVIFVIDSSDYHRLDECKVVLEEVLSHDKISGKPVLVLANKQDKEGALDDLDVVEKLNIEPLVNKYRCPTLVESYSASTTTTKSKKPKLDPGLKKGYLWLLNYIVRRYGDINLRVQTDIHAELERRQRLIAKASNRASQTFTAVSDDIATQTGFENPKYETLTRESATDKEKDIESGVIIVKPITHASNSLDTTATIESVDDSGDTSNGGKPKLSPLFGRASGSSTVTENAKVELESRREFRKLSPIVRNRSEVDQHIDFQNRPQSSPTVRDKNGLQSKDTSSRDTNTFRGGDTTEVFLDEWRHNAVMVDDAELTKGQREIVFSERSERCAKSASPEGGGAPRLEGPRAASASRLVRRQLEACHNKRRLSLRYVRRNKTSPERLSVFHYEPKQLQRQLDKGDFELSPARRALRDLTL